MYCLISFFFYHLCTNMVYGLDTRALNNIWPSLPVLSDNRIQDSSRKLKMAIRRSLFVV